MAVLHAAELVRTSRQRRFAGLHATPGVPVGSAVPDEFPSETSQSADVEQLLPGAHNAHIGPPQSTSDSPASMMPLRHDEGSRGVTDRELVALALLEFEAEEDNDCTPEGVADCDGDEVVLSDSDRLLLINIEGLSVTESDSVSEGETVCD